MHAATSAHTVPDFTPSTRLPDPRIRIRDVASHAGLDISRLPVVDTADDPRQASTVAVSSRESADKGGEVVGSAVAAMGEINHSSKKIAEIITGGYASRKLRPPPM